MPLDEEWKVGKRAERCTRCGRELDRGAAHFAALVEEPVTEANRDGLRRADFCPDCWTLLAASLREKGVLPPPPPPRAEPARRRRRQRAGEPRSESPSALVRGEPAETTGTPSPTPKPPPVPETPPPAVIPVAPEAAAATDSALASEAPADSAPPADPLAAATEEFLRVLETRFLSFWRVVPAPAAEAAPRRPRFLDDEAVLDAFKALEGTEVKAEQNFRYILALHLRRRRLLKQVETLTTGRRGAPRTLVFQERQNETDRFRVLEPEMSTEELLAVQEALTRMLSPEYRERLAQRQAAQAAQAAAGVAPTDAPPAGAPPAGASAESIAAEVPPAAPPESGNP